MQQRKAPAFGLSVGSSCFLIIFVVLALTAFATLSLATANSDYRLTKRTTQAVLDYYAADSLAITAIAELTAAVQAAGSAASLTSVAIPLGWTDEGATVSLQIPMNDGMQTLELAVRLTDGELELIRWQTTNASSWEDEESLSLFDEETFNLLGAPLVSGEVAG